MRFYYRCLSLFIALSISISAIATHIVGGEFTYRYLGDTVVNGANRLNYEVTLYIYQDCNSGDPGAIADDDPAFFTIFENGSDVPALVDTAVYYDRQLGSMGSIEIPIAIANSSCHSGLLSGAPERCLLRKKFTRRYALNPGGAGYKVVYQRCCRQNSLSNIIGSSEQGVTYFCDIPPSGIHNSSAQFGAFPAQIICMGKELHIDQSATDIDGDSLSYELSAPLVGASADVIKPKIGLPPPYSKVSYVYPYNEFNPIDAIPPVIIDAQSGMITGTPNTIGTYLLKIDCHEWRNGAIINTVSREFSWTVANCQSIENTLVVDAGGDRSVLVGEKVQFNVTGGDRYYWSPGTFLDNAFVANPVGTFTKPGQYVYRIAAVDDSGCSGNTEIKVNVLEHSDVYVPTAFTPNADGVNDVLTPIPVKGSSIKAFNVFNRWGNQVCGAAGGVPGWDGRFNGELQPSAAYVWSVDYVDTNGQTHIKTGTSILLR
ncbi:MAG: gliding motility-associated C-terminal domain-containing protein [Taibaiella sp.]|nr:gliding motility-associated C-terminal domain-containing protein [Taibaiella sp.]